MRPTSILALVALAACDSPRADRPKPVEDAAPATPEICDGMPAKVRDDGYLELASLGPDGETLPFCLSLGERPGDPHAKAGATTTECYSANVRTHGVVKAVVPAFFAPEPRFEAEETSGYGKHTIKLRDDGVTVCANTTTEDCKVISTGAADPPTAATWGRLWQRPPADVSVEGTLLVARHGALEAYGVASARRTAKYEVPGAGSFVARITWMGKRAFVVACDASKKDCAGYLLDPTTSKSSRVESNGKPLQLWGIRDSVIRLGGDAWAVIDASGSPIVRVRGDVVEPIVSFGEAHAKPAFAAKRANGDIVVAQAAPFGVTVVSAAGAVVDRFDCKAR